jgi:UDP-GlcNAc:undecaprenyl-phosphate GlcNAc-1-phosphate transferase
MEVGGLDYAAVFAVTAALTLILTPLAMRAAFRQGILDRPGLIKAQASPVPYLGGLAILVAFTVVVLIAAAVRPPPSGLSELAIILGVAVGLALMGLIDDIRGLSPWLRLLLEIAAGVIVWSSPAGADVFTADVPNLLITVLWIVAVTNAVNLLDNMDGLSAGVCGLAAFFIWVMAASNGQFLVATLAIAVAGCAVGFLRSNFHPARIYMGDAGALFLGFLLGVLALKLSFPAAPKVVALGVPVLVLGVPIFDTAVVTVNRILHGRSPLAGGRDHTSHRLVFIGIPVPAAVTLIYVIAGSLGCLAIVLSRVDRSTGLILLGWVVALALLLGVLVSLVPVYESSRRRHLMLQEVARHTPEPEPDDEDDASEVREA